MKRQHPVTDQRSKVWTQKYRELLAGLIESAGGEDQVSATRRVTLNMIATLQTQMVMLSVRFASDATGATSDDINQYLKMSSNVAELMQAAGLSKQQQQAPVDYSAARDKLHDILLGIIQARTEDDAKREEERKALEKEIERLKKLRDSLAVAAPAPKAAPPRPLVQSPPPLKVVRAEKSTTAKFYDWANSGGLGYP
jgi:hypothetical protein